MKMKRHIPRLIFLDFAFWQRNCVKATFYNEFEQNVNKAKHKTDWYVHLRQWTAL